MSIEQGNYVILSEVAARIWELIEMPKDVDAVCVQLQVEYDVSPETCRAEVISFVDELVKHCAVTVDPLAIP